MRCMNNYEVHAVMWKFCITKNVFGKVSIKPRPSTFLSVQNLKTPSERNCNNSTVNSKEMQVLRGGVSYIILLSSQKSCENWFIQNLTHRKLFRSHQNWINKVSGSLCWNSYLNRNTELRIDTVLLSHLLLTLICGLVLYFLLYLLYMYDQCWIMPINSCI